MKKIPLLVLLFLPSLAVSEGLPDLGDISQTVLSPMQERQIGHQSMLQIRASKQYLDDVEVSDYLNQIGYKLVQHSAEPTLGFEFFALDDNNINAFAMPGGYIGVNSGLLLTAQSESELAAVLSHEIAHVTQHHLARILAAQKNDGWSTMAALALAILTSRTNPQAAEAAIASAQAHTIQKQLDFTRTHEQEADRIGLDILEKSNFSVHAMPEFLNRLQLATRLIEGHTPTYLRTHPITSDRVGDIENRVSKRPYRLIPDSLDFQLVRAKLLASRKSTADAITYFSDALGAQKHGEPLAQRYGLIISLLRNNEIDRAAQELAILRKQVKAHRSYENSPMIEVLAGQVLRSQNDRTDALTFYGNAVQNFPQHRALVYDYAELLLQSGRNDIAAELLAEHLTRHPSDIRLYDLQAKAYAMMDKRLEQHQAQAYSLAWQGNLHAAIQQLELARQAGGSFYQLSVIESDIRELRDILAVQSQK